MVKNKNLTPYIFGQPIQLNPKIHPYRLIRNGKDVGWFTNYILAMNTGDMRKRLERENSPNDTQAEWLVKWGTESHIVKRIVQHREKLELPDIGEPATTLIQ